MRIAKELIVVTSTELSTSILIVIPYLEASFAVLFIILFDTFSTASFLFNSSLISAKDLVSGKNSFSFLSINLITEYPPSFFIGPNTSPISID